MWGYHTPHVEVTMEQLRNRMISDFALGNYSPRTAKEYLRCVRNFTGHYMRCPSQLGKEEVRGFLHHLLVVRGKNPPAIKGYIASLKFLYTHTLERPEVVAWIPYPKVHSKLPAVLDPTEVKEILVAIEPPLFRALFVTAYATALRVSEVCSLTIGDLDSRRGVIRIRGKGGRERYVPLREKLLGVLRRYYRSQRPQGTWLFPAARSDRHVSPNRARIALRKAVRKTSVKKHVTPHVLRHSCATHLLEAGVELRVIQALLGHASIRTTVRYARVSTRLIKGTIDPLEIIERQPDPAQD
jgi:integrase/recombinase XerD